MADIASRKVEIHNFSEMYLRCGCLEAHNAVGFQGTGIHDFILAYADFDTLVKYNQMFREYTKAEHLHTLRD